MKISHRGNISGSKSAKFGENNPKSIDFIIDNFNLDVEIDIWMIDGSLYLGHDVPQYQISFEFLKNRKSKLWIHAKNLEALDFFISKDFNYFWHENDSYTLTSKNYIWTYPHIKNYLTKNSIAVMPELVPKWDLSTCYGICSDFIG